AAKSVRDSSPSVTEVRLRLDRRARAQTAVALRRVNIVFVSSRRANGGVCADYGTTDGAVTGRRLNTDRWAHLPPTRPQAAFAGIVLGPGRRLQSFYGGLVRMGKGRPGCGVALEA